MEFSSTQTENDILQYPIYDPELLPGDLKRKVQLQGTADDQEECSLIGMDENMSNGNDVPNDEDIQSLLDAWMNPGDFDSIPSSPAGYAVDDPEGTYTGQWKKMEELSRTGSNMIKTEIDRFWIEMSETPFNINFRKFLSDFIERKSWHSINTSHSDPGSSSMRIASTIISQLQSEVRAQLTQLTHSPALAPPDFRFQLQMWYDKLTNVYVYRPMEVVQLMQRILTQEKYIISLAQQEASQASGAGMYDTSNAAARVKVEANSHLVHIAEITQEISRLEQISQRAAGIIEDITQRVQQLQVWTDERVHALDHFDVRQLNPEHQRKWHDLKQRKDMVIADRKNMIEKCHVQHINELQAILIRVLNEELVQWQRNQAYMNNGKNVAGFCSITQLENWCKRLAKLINNNIQQMTRINRLDVQLGIAGQTLPDQPQTQSVLDVLSQNYATFLQELVQKGLVVEKQPPQVLMKDKRFQCQLRHLVSDGLDIHQVHFEVDTWLINSEQATKVMNDPSASFSPTGKINNSTARSDFIDHLHQLSVNMRNMCLKMQQRGANRNAEMVAELKFVMLFRTTIAIRFPPNQTRTVVAQTMSLPIVVISHGKQEADAQATIFWDNAFAKVGRIPFEVDESVPWTWMLDALDCRWRKECDEGGMAVGLSESSKEYLTMKLFNEKRVPEGTLISWKKFNHDKMFTCGETRKELFTFWTWFFKAMELVSSAQVKKYWNEGIIHGFLSKVDCQRMLQESGVNGVFLYRFSETKLGAVSISCNKNVNGQSRVCHLEPDVIKNFIVRSLPAMVFDLEYLHYLYPMRPKEEIFSNHYADSVREPTNTGDYIAKEFKVHTRDPAGFDCQPALSPSGVCSQDQGNPGQLSMEDDMN